MEHVVVSLDGRARVVQSHVRKDILDKIVLVNVTVTTTEHVIL